jgi:hypothetical protein
LDDLTPGVKRPCGLRAGTPLWESGRKRVRDALLRAADLEPFLRRTLDLKLEALAR